MHLLHSGVIYIVKEPSEIGVSTQDYLRIWPGTLPGKRWGQKPYLFPGGAVKSSSRPSSPFPTFFPILFYFFIFGSVMRINRSRSNTGPGPSPVWKAPESALQIWKENSKEETTDDPSIQKSFI